MREMSEHARPARRQRLPRRRRQPASAHPLRRQQPDELERAEEFGADILRLCVEVGGVLTGEHGVGVEKRDLMGVMFTRSDLDQQQRVKCAFDPNGCSIPARCSRSCTAAPSSAACTCIAGRSRSPTAAVLSNGEPSAEPAAPRDGCEAGERRGAPEAAARAAARGGRRRQQARLAADAGDARCSTYRLLRHRRLRAGGAGPHRAAATPIAEIEALLGADNQMLAFEPPDSARCWAEAGQTLIGGVSPQPRRPAADHGRRRARPLPGLQRRQRPRRAFKAGGKVVKNVTGYDSPSCWPARGARWPC